MIDLYTWTTPNGEKPVIMLEECSAEYSLHMTNIGKNEQKSDSFLAINPNGKIPALVDDDGGDDQRVFESGAMLVYLAEKFGRFLSASGPERAETLGWTFFQVGNTGPMLGQYHHFASHKDERIDYAIERYRNESRRCLGVLDGRLADRDYLAGDYSIADMMNYSWAVIGLKAVAEDGEFAALRAWAERVGSREAVQRALKRLKDAGRR